MQAEALGTPAEALAALTIVRELFGGSLVAVYLHGSAVSGGLRPKSDVDLLVVTDRAPTDEMRKRLVAALMAVSGRHPADPAGPRCIELIVLLESQLSSPAYPARSELVYGEWLRDAFEAGEIPMPVSDPELTLVLAQARREARALVGPPVVELLPRIPDDHVLRAMRELLPPLLDSLEGDEANVLLTLARMWRTAATGEFVTKDAAAEWSIPRLPEFAADMIARARDAYLHGAEGSWSRHSAEVLQTATYLRRRVAEAL